MRIPPARWLFLAPNRRSVSLRPNRPQRNQPRWKRAAKRSPLLAPAALIKTKRFGRDGNALALQLGLDPPDFAVGPLFFAARLPARWLLRPAARRGRMTDALHDPKIELAAVNIDVGHLYANDIAQSIAIAAAIAGQAMRGAVVAIKVVVKRID